MLTAVPVSILLVGATGFSVVFLVRRSVQVVVWYDYRCCVLFVSHLRGERHDSAGVLV